LKGRHFGTLDNIQKSVTDELRGIPAEAFQHCYEKWKQRLRRCVAAQGNYIEGNNLDLLKKKKLKENQSHNFSVTPRIMSNESESPKYFNVLFLFLLL